jgi:DNA polymerase IV
MHVDMDAFFVACEMRRHPELVGKAVIVGGSGDRGVVAACSYEARRFGVHSAMASVRARRLCPHAVVLQGDHAYYGEVSTEVRAVFDSITPHVEPIALDEAFLDITGARRLLGEPRLIGQTIRDRIQRELQLACSVGIAPTKMAAKMASEAAKPVARPEGITAGRGVVEVSVEELVAFVQAHPVRALWGVGPKTHEKLTRLGVTTIADLAELGEAALVRALGASNGRHLHQLSCALDARPVESDRALRSISHEETFSHDRYGVAEVRSELIRMCDSVSTRIRANQCAARTVSVKVRFGDFSTVTRSVTLAAPVDGAAALLRSCDELLASIAVERGIRLLGVVATNLVTDARQLSLDDLTGPSEASAAVDEIRRRFGSAAIGSAASASNISSGPGSSAPWGPARAER